MNSCIPILFKGFKFVLSLIFKLKNSHLGQGSLQARFLGLFTWPCNSPSAVSLSGTRCSEASCTSLAPALAKDISPKSLVSFSREWHWETEITVLGPLFLGRHYPQASPRAFSDAYFYFYSCWTPGLHTSLSPPLDAPPLSGSGKGSGLPSRRDTLLISRNLWHSSLGCPCGVTNLYMYMSHII